MASLAEQLTAMGLGGDDLQGFVDKLSGLGINDLSKLQLKEESRYVGGFGSNVLLLCSLPRANCK